MDFIIRPSSCQEAPTIQARDILHPMDPTLALVIQIAENTGKFLLEASHDQGIKVALKDDRSIVTEADLAADHKISSILKENFPDDAILSEELQPILRNEDAQDTPAVWIVDPVDGSTNYSLGLHYWGVSISRLVDGWPDLAVYYFPAVDELYWAQRGQGAFLNGQAIHVQNPDSSRPLSFFTCCSRTHRLYNVSIPYKTRILGSTAYSLCCLARGLALVDFEATPKIWDIVGGWLLINEAGGAIETLNGSQPFPLRTEVDYIHQDYPLISAATPQLLAKAREQIRPRQS
jgi:myo-inositol-1(or 4)-monophosphatase